jgi:hypothetical protein
MTGWKGNLMRNLFIAILIFFAISASFVLAEDNLQVVAAVKDTLFTPNSSMLYAAADIKKIPSDDQAYVRYFSLYNIPKAKRKAYAQTISFIINSLSREGTIEPPKFVADSDETVLRIDLRDYQIKSASWDELGKKGSGIRPAAEPYFHTLLEKTEIPVEKRIVEKTKEVIVGYDYYKRPIYQSQSYTETIEIPGKPKVTKLLGNGLWLDAKASAYLIEKTQTEFPIFRGDWFVTNASVPPAYYNFLGLGNKEEDFEKLVFTDSKLAAKAKSEIKGVVILSGVARNNRTVLRSPTFTNGYFWATHDTLKSIDDRDYMRNFLDEKFDATEIIATLSNGLQAYFLANGKGERQDAAPTDIAIDNTAADRTVRNGRSCIVCHVAGLQPIDEEIRNLTQKLTDKDKINLLVTKQDDYLRIKNFFKPDIVKRIAADQQIYAEAILEANGLKMEVNATQFAQVYDNYAESLLTLDEVAREVAVPSNKLERYIAQSDDPHILGLTKNPVRALRRDQWEQSFPGFMLVILAGDKN